MSEEIKAGSAAATFHHPDYKHNCAQAIAYKWRRLYADPDTVVARMQACGGGRAEGGLCGALHAALQIVPAERRDKFMADFAARAGSLTCAEIKRAAKTPCPRCVAIADELLEACIGAPQ